jgi:hypothetical protein
MRRPTRRLALWMLERVARGNEPLVGDLVEECRTRPLRLTLWRELLHATMHRSNDTDLDAYPLRLSAARSVLPTERRSVSRPARTINLSGGPVPGIGGLSVIALASLLTAMNPHIWWLAAYSLLGGCLVGVVLATMRQRRGLRVRSSRLLGAL